MKKNACFFNRFAKYICKFVWNPPVSAEFVHTGGSFLT